MKVLTLNAGSSSLKYKLFSAPDLRLLASGLAERIGAGDSLLHNRWLASDGRWRESEYRGVTPTHATAIEHTFADLGEEGVLRNRRDLMAVGHRVVHGGERFIEPLLIDDASMDALGELDVLAPLHNPANLLGIEVARRLFPRVPHVAVFDTAFHHTLPPHASRYALPAELYRRLCVRRFGFHGTSVQYVSRRLAQLIDRPLERLNLIVLHLGNGASVTAVQNGMSVDTSMGMTPLEGLVMGTRCGDLDPAIAFHLLRHGGYDAPELEHLFFHDSGLKGVCGRSDMRAIHAAADSGDEAAQLALDMFAYRVRKYLGAYTAVLGHVDAVVFTAGIGEHDPDMRERCLAGLEGMGLVLDRERNLAVDNDARAVNAPDSPVAIWVIPTDEELEIARCTVQRIGIPLQEANHE